MAIVTLEISPELEQQLRAEAAKQGVNPSLYILNTLQERLQFSSSSQPHLSKTESELLQEINIGLSEETWQQYHTLIAKRRAETLTPEEHTTLIEITDQLEQLNVSRIQALIELARLRGASLKTVMQSLGIQAPTYV